MPPPMMGGGGVQDDVAAAAAAARAAAAKIAAQLGTGDSRCANAHYKTSLSHYRRIV